MQATTRNPTSKNSLGFLISWSQLYFLKPHSFTVNVLEITGKGRHQLIMIFRLTNILYWCDWKARPVWFCPSRIKYRHISNIASLVPDHHSKAIITTKQVTAFLLVEGLALICNKRNNWQHNKAMRNKSGMSVLIQNPGSLLVLERV